MLPLYVEDLPLVWQGSQTKKAFHSSSWFFGCIFKRDWICSWMH